MDRQTNTMEIPAHPTEARNATLSPVAPERRYAHAVTEAATEGTTQAFAVPFSLCLVALTLAAFVLRALLAGSNSAFMDEGTFALNGRMLIEQHTRYAGYLTWSYGSDLWTLLAGLADKVGGLLAMRLLTAALGALMVLATALTVRALAPASMSPVRRDTAALVAGALIAALPTAIAVGRFATYDPLAGAALMGCIAVLATTWRTGHQRALLGAATLLFIAFLSKYVVAIYVPFICLWMMIAPLASKPRQPARFTRNVCWFVLPLCVTFAAYAFVFRAELLTLLTFSKSYTDLKSSDPFRLYIVQRPELCALVGVALIGWRWASVPGRIFSIGGAGIILAFQALSRPDADWWKHSIYLIFFLAPLVGFALAPAIERLLPQIHRARPGFGRTVAVLLVTVVVVPLAGLTMMYLSTQRELGQWRHVSISVLLLVLVPAGLILAPLGELILEERGKRLPQGLWRALAAVAIVGIIAPIALGASLRESNRVATDYPNLRSSVDAIRAESAHARRILADDSVIRYYLYGQDPNIPVASRVIDPFSVMYRGMQGINAYRRLIADRYVDVIVLDGGVGPVGQQIRKQLSDEIPLYYDRVYERQDRGGTLVQIYRAKAVVSMQSGPTPDGAAVYGFDRGAQGWGAHVGEVKPGVGVTVSQSQRWNDQPSLQFIPDSQTQMVGVRQDAPVSRVRAQIYVEPKGDSGSDVILGMIGFNEQWQWRDDGFKQSIPTGRWVEVSWNLSQPGVYHEIALMFPGTAQISAVYLGQVEVDP